MQVHHALSADLAAGAATAAATSMRQAARADIYAVIGALLLAPPDGALLQLLREAEPPLRDPDLMLAWQQLARAACETTAPAAADEHAALFVAVGTPTLDPRASVYRGSMALSALREDLRALGLERSAAAAWPEDHLGALCEVLRLLVEAQRPQRLQGAFFRRHVAPWYGAFLADLRRVDGVPLHAALAGVVQAFFDLEAVELDDDTNDNDDGGA
jgi:TorA maturation chaperone TorD